MKQKSAIDVLLRRSLIGLMLWSLGQTSAVACSGEFYVIWIEAEASSQMYVRSKLTDPSGVSDRYGIMNLADDALGGINPSYIHRMAMHSFMNLAKVFITTDDTDCVIDSNGENLGNVNDIQPGN